MFLKLLASLAGSAVLFGLYQILKLVYQVFNSPVRHLPGPKPTHFFFGNFREIWKAENSVMHEQWVQEYGPTIKYQGLFGITRLYTVDPKALNHFLSNTHIYQKGERERKLLARILGPGILIAEGDVHRQQRKIMNPAFGAPQIRELTEVFVKKSIELRDIWASQIPQSGTARIDVLQWLTKVTLDIIGLAGFNYNFDSLSSTKQSELAEAFHTVFQSGTALGPIRILQMWLPIFRLIRTKEDRAMERSMAVMRRIGLQLLQDSKNEMVQNGTEKGRSRDLLSLLVRANTAKDIPASQRLSDEDVLAQVPTFLVAGHETTVCRIFFNLFLRSTRSRISSSAVTWALFALTQNVAAQTRLRNELLSVPTDEPTMDELNALSYLDCVVKETMRIHAPVPSSMRTAIQDDIVPLSQSFTDIHGVVHDTLKITKGQTIMIPILAMNRDKAIWGPDAMEFVPERWESDIKNALPGVWGHMLTFLGGPRACIGYRFSLVEMKALLFTLVRAFEFELAVPVEDMGKKSAVVQRPLLKSQPEAGNQMPLLIKPYVQS
ncbi:cytochrome P450 [Mycena metata]|uniref:Cytochrome P450 n=1 Tax=Mycena metata TaxID=1033252 RepID=A0AAD7N8B5_9AGAR|nr:cytochrome P450 [Mycena metata]